MRHHPIPLWPCSLLLSSITFPCPALLWSHWPNLPLPPEALVILSTWNTLLQVFPQLFLLFQVLAQKSLEAHLASLLKHNLHSPPDSFMLIFFSFRFLIYHYCFCCLLIILMNEWIETSRAVVLVCKILGKPGFESWFCH